MQAEAFRSKIQNRPFGNWLGAVARYKAEKMLLDGRNVKGKPKDIERFYYSEFAATETHRIVVAHRIVPRFTYVLHDPLSDPARLGETVAVNRGMSMLPNG